MSKPLLPSSASVLERAIESATERIGLVDVPIHAMWSPATAPAKALPWLAWSLSLDEWGSEWPEDVKRSAIASSPQVHRLKGTVGAVRRALSALGVDIELVEWWQNGGEPHTASLVAYASRNLNESGQTLLTPQLQQQIWNVVQRTKPARSHLDFTIGVSLSSGVSMAATATTFDLGRHAYDLTPPDVELSGALSSAAVVREPMAVSRAGVVTDGSCQLVGEAVLYGVPVSCVINRFSMRVS